MDGVTGELGPSSGAPGPVVEPGAAEANGASSGAPVSDSIARIRSALGAVIQGQEEAVEFMLACLIAGGHLLLEDVPGTGKTTLARAVAAATGLDFKRVQMTADLLPSDLTGARYPSLEARPSEGGGREFEFVPGPLFSQVVLADELNRTPPRTQSALLECMAEGRVTIDGETHELPQPFFVVATQNPIEFAGTFPLPESQLDRFMMRLALGYPDRDAERRILRDRRRSDPLTSLARAIGADELARVIAAVDDVVVNESVEDYVLDIVAATRTSPEFELGASPRGALDLERAARALALLDGRRWVTPEDVRRLAVPTLAHRLAVVDSHAYASGGDDRRPARTPEEAALAAALERVEAPRLGADGTLSTSG